MDCNYLYYLIILLLIYLIYIKYKKNNNKKIDNSVEKYKGKVEHNMNGSTNYRSSNFHKELTPWSDMDISNHPDYYKLDNNSKITNIGSMFNNRLEYVDKGIDNEIDSNKYKQPIIKSSKKEKLNIINNNNKVEKVYENERIINGGNFYQGVVGYDGTNDIYDTPTIDKNNIAY